MRVSVRDEAFLRRHFGPEGRLRPATAPLHTALIAQELLLERLVDAVKSPPPTEEPLLRQLTALVKTFERPRILRRLLASIRRLYPTLEVVVVDDSREPQPIDGVRTITMPYDSGISAGRNEGLRQVATEYVLLLDDDVVFFRHTRLGQALALMERHPEIDIMGGELIDLPFYKARRYADAQGAVFPTDARPAVPIGSSVGGLPVCAKVPNFFLARRDRLALVPWDPQLKRMEHADFFTRALGVLTTVSNPNIRCLHARTPFDVEYMQRRMDLVASGEVLDDRYGK
jgi:glycosyltransferase involved in cell wall biosynthesis